MKQLQLAEWMRDATKARGQESSQFYLEDANDRHIRLLEHVRDLKMNYWTGVNVRDIDLQSTSLEDFLTGASTTSSEQPKLRNSMAFTLGRAIDKARRIRQQNRSQPTTSIIIGASPIFDTEKEHLLRKLQGVKGGASEQSVQSIIFSQFMSKQDIRSYKRLDNSNSGDDDIIDVTFLDETAFFQYGGSPELWVKLFK